MTNVRITGINVKVLKSTKIMTATHGIVTAATLASETRTAKM